MELITDPELIPPTEDFNRVSVTEQVDGGYWVSATNNDAVYTVSVGSIGINGESAGFHGEATFERAASTLRLEYIDLTDEYDYDELQIVFADDETLK